MNVPGRVDARVLIDDTTNYVDVILGDAHHLKIDVMAALFICTVDKQHGISNNTEMQIKQ